MVRLKSHWDGSRVSNKDSEYRAKNFSVNLQVLTMKLLHLVEKLRSERFVNVNLMMCITAMKLP